MSGQVAQGRMTSRSCSQSGGQSPAQLKLKLLFRFGSKEVVVDLDERYCSVEEGQRDGGQRRANIQKAEGSQEPPNLLRTSPA